MRKSERNKIVKEIHALVCAAEDMRQVEAAAVALQNEHQNGLPMRALETAAVVCYGRTFSGGAIGLRADEWMKDEDEGAHTALNDLRDKVYAHTDKSIKIEGLDSPYVRWAVTARAAVEPGAATTGTRSRTRSSRSRQAGRPRSSRRRRPG
jgi:hypothetical protein